MLNQFELCSAPITAAAYEKCDSIVLFLCKECAPAVPQLELPVEAAKAVEAYLAAHDDVYDVGALTSFVLPTEGGLLQLIIAGCGEGSDCKPNNFRKAAGEAARALHKAKARQAVCAAPILLNPQRGFYAQALAEGLFLGGYTFNRFKSKAKEAPLCAVKLLSSAEDSAKLVEVAEIEAEAVCFTRDLVNNPGNIVTPQVMVEAALAMGKELPLEVTVLDEVLLKDRGMEAILAVGRGSENPPRMIALQYNGAAMHRTLPSLARV